MVFFYHEAKMVSRTPSSAHGRDTAERGELFPEQRLLLPEIHREQLGGSMNLLSSNSAQMCAASHSEQRELGRRDVVEEHTSLGLRLFCF